MAARRLIIIMLVLLAISTVLALVLPSRSTKTGDNAAPAPKTETISDPAELTSRTTGEVVSAHFDFPSKKEKVVGVHRGDQLILTVTGSIGDDIEIPRFGLTETVTPYAPAVFNLIVDEAGTFPVRAVEADLVVGKIVSANPRPRRASGRPGSR